MSIFFFFFLLSFFLLCKKASFFSLIIKLILIIQKFFLFNNTIKKKYIIPRRSNVFVQNGFVFVNWVRPLLSWCIHGRVARPVGKPIDLVRSKLTTKPFAGICSTTELLVGQVDSVASELEVSFLSSTTANYELSNSSR